MFDYREMQAPVSDHEIAMEKTPAYFHTQPHELPEIMINDNAKVKLVLILCEPSRRALSDYAMRVSSFV